MRNRTLRLIALTGVVAIGFTGVAVAGGEATEVTRFKTKALGPGSAEYKVRIDSADECVEGRLVQIKHKGVVIGTGNTDADGKVTILGPRPPRGDKVTAKVLPDGECEAVSKTRKFKP